MIPVTRLQLGRGGFSIDPKSISKINTVSELARVDPEALRAYFMRRDIYEAAHSNEKSVAPPSMEAIDCAILTLMKYKQSEQ